MDLSTLNVTLGDSEAIIKSVVSAYIDTYSNASVDDYYVAVTKNPLNATKHILLLKFSKPGGFLGIDWMKLRVLINNAQTEYKCFQQPVDYNEWMDEQLMRYANFGWSTSLYLSKKRDK